MGSLKQQGVETKKNNFLQVPVRPLKQIYSSNMGTLKQ
jgi:hypothetical protein